MAMTAGVGVGVGVDVSVGVNVNMDEAGGYNRSACTECQRRKQKCNREWPCDRCQRRKIADECRYSYYSASDTSRPSLVAPSRDVDDEHTLPPAGDEPRSSASAARRAEASRDSPPADIPGFDTLAAARLFHTLGIESKIELSRTAPKEDLVAVDSSPQIDRVLKLLPQRQSMDKLINVFLHDVNYHYYIVYPPDFLREYHIWWERLSSNRPITVQYTCLLAMICACCVQHTDTNMQQELQRASGLNAENLSEQLHCAVRELASVVPVGHYHIFNVQRLLHSCYWYKAEARFLEAWHVLSTAVLEARELGYHREPPPDTETSHEREMRRRLWCILDTWDWQISSGLSRPMIINRVDCNSQLPSLTLESFSDHAPSPLLHMKMQSELTRQLASRFSAPKNIIKPSEVQEYKALIEAWVHKFPPVYQFDRPDTSKDAQYAWIFPHRYYLDTMACLLILNPIRHYMVRSYTWQSPPDELSVRATGVAYSLKLMKTLRSWVDCVYNRDGRLHFIIFSIFDTAAILCTAIIKDSQHTITERGEMMDAIGDAIAMLERLNTISKISRTSYDLLERLARRLPQPTMPRIDRKKAKASGVSRPAPATARATAASCARGHSNGLDLGPTPQPLTQSNHEPANGVRRMSSSMSMGSSVRSDGRSYLVHSTCYENTPRNMDGRMMSSLSTAGNRGAYANFPPPAYVGPPQFELETVTQAQLGELAPLWNWHSGNLDFANTSDTATGPGYMPPPRPPIM